MRRVTIGLIDNDILLKLLAFDLFDEAILSLNLSSTSLRVLSTARFVFQQKRQQQRTYNDQIWQQALLLTEQCQSIPEPPPESLLDYLAELQQLEPFRNSIDEGETELILATRYTPDFILLSGDKRCLSALPQIPTEIYSRLAGRVVCLELLLLELMEQLGYETLRSRIQPALQYDKTAKVCFGYSRPATEAEARQALQSYLNDIQRLAPGLLADLS